MKEVILKTLLENTKNIGRSQSYIKTTSNMNSKIFGDKESEVIRYCQENQGPFKSNIFEITDLGMRDEWL